MKKKKKKKKKKQKEENQKSRSLIARRLYLILNDKHPVRDENATLLNSLLE